MTAAGERIRELRQQRGLSQEELRELIEQDGRGPFGEVTLSRLESGSTRSPRASTLARVAQALDVEAAALTAPDLALAGGDDRADVVSALLTIERHLAGHEDADLDRARAWLQQVRDRHGW